MNLLFLRGQVPTDRNPKQIKFDNLASCDDMWTQLAFSLLSKSDYGEVWYWGGSRNQQFADNFWERWVRNFRSTRYDFDADIIIARGGFPEYDSVAKRHKNALKIYYGAGKRFLPESKFRSYDIILVDSIKQQKIARSRFPKAKSHVFVKPAAENVFYPIDREKKYDVIFVPNMYSPRKRCEFFLSKVPDSLKVLVVGDVKHAMVRRKNITYAGWVPRKRLRKLYAESKVSVCPSSGGDSCPRVIPESLACNVPILVSDDVNVWRDKYIHSSASEVSPLKTFFTKLTQMVKNYRSYRPYEYYSQNLSLDVAAKYIKEMLW